MPKSTVTRKQLLVATAPVAAAVPLAKLGLAGAGTAASPPTHAGSAMDAIDHAAMIGGEVPAPGEPNDLATLLYPPMPLPHQPGRVRGPRSRHVVPGYLSGIIVMYVTGLQVA